MNNPETHFKALVVVLENSPLFSTVSPDLVKELAGKMKISAHLANETIIYKNEPGDSIFFIVEGEVRVHDQEHLVAMLGKGEFFGDMSILDNEPRSMSVTASIPTITGSILRNDFYDVSNKFPGITEVLVSFLIRRLRKQNNVMVEQLRNRHKELEVLVAERTSDLESRNLELQAAINQIKQSQQQLILQEKLASLGSLTSGVAHELHNPLNFVNNFTELCLEIINDSSASDSAESFNQTQSTIKKNLEKILFHGQRADSIIKAMLMHSNTSPQKKALSNINMLCDQAVSMISYNATNLTKGCFIRIHKDFSSDLPEIELVPRDISKVVINILNNAIYELYRVWKKSGNSFYRKLLSALLKQIILF
ncbi:MAG: cyclic nucleotide-binding domain-containing protein [Bacteroidetes bacterium]|nr:cyclic nucleotide-binding domain-containing protein [Bacteroidota bacterium]